jgi:HAD superfamily phosphoserine phosphatase-like hydrolase
MVSRRLVIFDVEGVLLPKNRYMVFELGRKLSFPQFVRLLFIGLFYELRLLSLESALRRIFRLFEGFSVEELMNIFAQVPLLPYIEVVFAKIREKELKTALVSSGLPQVVVENLASRLGADYAFGLELETNNNVLTGNIKGDVIKPHGKDIVVEKILGQEGLTREDCVVVADDRNNAPIFYSEALKLGYNPDFLIAFKSDHVIKENPLEIISILEGVQERPRRFLSLNEVIREAIHGSGFFVVFAALYLGAYQTAFLLSLTTLVYTASELARVERKNTPVITSITLKAATFPERYEFTTAPIFFALGLTLSLLLFPPPINYASIAMVSLGDSAASVFGKVFGKTHVPYNKGKNLEGSLAGFAFSFLGAALFLHPVQAFAGAFFGMFVESLPLPVNDNLSVPLVTGTLLTVLS